MKSLLEGRLIVMKGDITRETVDAVVNAANSSLMGGGGVDGAIHRAGGPAILEECKKLRQERYPDGLPAGEAALTTGGRMPAAHVIHTVGPVWHGGSRNEDAILAGAYRSSLALAHEQRFGTVAFPAISTGIYGFPRERAAKIVIATIRDFLNGHETPHEVRLVFFSEDDMSLFLSVAESP